MDTDKVYLVDYFGFVYIWRDNLKHKYYIGSHLGPTNDSYIGSNKWLKAAYKKRPESFKRRVLTYLDTDYGSSLANLQHLQMIEQKWLDLIKDTELAQSQNVVVGSYRYYNMKKIAAGGSHKGHTKNRKSPAWNLGITSHILNLRRQGLFCLMCDKPKIKEKCASKKQKSNKAKPQVCCYTCHSMFFASKASQKFCSASCNPVTSLKQKLPKQKKPKVPWNKGKRNPTASLNGKKGAQKQSTTVTGRRIMVQPNGTRIWVYPHDPEYNQVLKDRVIGDSTKVKKLKTQQRKIDKRVKFKKGSPELREHKRQRQLQVAKRGLDHKDASLWILKSPEGQVIEVINLPKFCNEMNLAITAIQYNAAANTLKPIKKGKSKGWTVIQKRKGG